MWSSVWLAGGGSGYSRLALWLCVVSPFEMRAPAHDVPASWTVTAGVGLPLGCLRRRGRGLRAQGFFARESLGAGSLK